VDFPAPAAPAGEPGDAATAPARPRALPIAAEAPTRSDRYAGWTLAADAISLVVWMANPPDIYYATPMLVLTPAIHAAHGELGSASLSLAMRLAMFGGVYGAAHLAREECRGDDGFICMPFGSIMLISAIVSSVVVVDATILARRERPARGWDAMPLLSAAVDGAGRGWLTLTGRF
jgi:hypothetical protein